MTVLIYNCKVAHCISKRSVFIKESKSFFIKEWVCFSEITYVPMNSALCTTISTALVSDEPWCNQNHLFKYKTESQFSYTDYSNSTRKVAFLNLPGFKSFRFSWTKTFEAFYRTKRPWYCNTYQIWDPSDLFLARFLRTSPLTCRKNFIHLPRNDISIIIFVRTASNDSQMRQFRNLDRNCPWLDISYWYE